MTTSRTWFRSHTDGRGTDAVIDAVGMEAHGSPIAETVQTAAGFLPSPVGRAVMKHAGVDRLAALNSAIALVRRGGTISLSGVYGGAADPINMMTLFDKQIQLRMGQANVKRWVPGHHAAAHRRRSARRRTVRHPPAAAELGARRLRDVPEEAGRHGQGGAQAREPGTRLTMDQSEAPLLDALIDYRQSNRYGFTPPGHRQGRGADDRVLEVLGPRAVP